MRKIPEQFLYAGTAVFLAAALAHGSPMNLNGEISSAYDWDALGSQRPSRTLENRFQVTLSKAVRREIEVGGTVSGLMRNSINRPGTLDGENLKIAPYLRLFESGRHWSMGGRFSRNPSVSLSQFSPVSDLAEFNIALSPPRLPLLAAHYRENHFFDELNSSFLDQQSREVGASAQYQWRYLSLDYQIQSNTFNDRNDRLPQTNNISEGFGISSSKDFRLAGYLTLSASYSSRATRSEQDDRTTAQQRSDYGNLGIQYSPNSRLQLVEKIALQRNANKQTAITISDLAFSTSAQYSPLKGLTLDYQNVTSFPAFNRPSPSTSHRDQLTIGAKPWTPVTLSIVGFRDEGRTEGTLTARQYGASINAFARIYSDLDAQFLANHNRNRFADASNSDNVSLSLTSRAFRATDIVLFGSVSRVAATAATTIARLSTSSYLANSNFRFTTNTEYRREPDEILTSSADVNWTIKEILFIKFGGNWTRRNERDLFTAPVTVSWRAKPTRRLVSTLEYSNGDVLKEADALKLEVSSSGEPDASLRVNYGVTRTRQGELSQNMNASVRKWF